MRLFYYQNDILNTNGELHEWSYQLSHIIHHKTGCRTLDTLYSHLSLNHQLVVDKRFSYIAAMFARLSKINRPFIVHWRAIGRIDDRRLFSRFPRRSRSVDVTRTREPNDRQNRNESAFYYVRRSTISARALFYCLRSAVLFLSDKRKLRCFSLVHKLSPIDWRLIVGFWCWLDIQNGRYKDM